MENVHKEPTNNQKQTENNKQETPNIYEEMQKVPPVPSDGEVLTSLSREANTAGFRRAADDLSQPADYTRVCFLIALLCRYLLNDTHNCQALKTT